MTTITCGHCAEPVKIQDAINVVINGHVQTMCSNTCLLAWASDREVQA